MHETRATENRKFVRRRLRERQPELADQLTDAAVQGTPGGGGADSARCECALNRARRFHAGYCPVAPGEQFRFTGAELLKRLGMEVST